MVTDTTRANNVAASPSEADVIDRYLISHHESNIVTSQTAPTIVIQSANRGFRWGDAALGAAAATGLILLAAGATRVLRRQAESTALQLTK